MYDVVALGEVLIDFTPLGKTSGGNPSFEQNAGGAPANVLAILSKLGKKTSFIGKVGDDQFGHFLKQTLEQVKIDTTGLVFSEEVRTTLAFVHLDDSGDRSFSFYRNLGADMTLTKDEVCTEVIANSSIFHFGSLSLTHPTVAVATFHAVEQAKQANKLISFDPNLRESLWSSLDAAKQMMLQGMQHADIVKVSEEELLFLTGKADLDLAAQELCSTYQLSLLFVTRGEKGCYYRCGSISGAVAAYQVKVVDTTGAGDAFFGGALYKLLDAAKSAADIASLSQAELEAIVAFANAAGGLTATRKGAISIMPTLDEIAALMNNQQ